jgi:hypothetical protein
MSTIALFTVVPLRHDDHPLVFLYDQSEQQAGNGGSNAAADE